MQEESSLQGPEPEAVKRRKRNNKSRFRVKENSPTMIEIGKWFDRRPTTLWTIEEAELLEAAMDESGEFELEMEEIGRYYLFPHQEEKDYRRRNVATMLRNWAGEGDKARKWLKNKAAYRADVV